MCHFITAWLHQKNQVKLNNSTVGIIVKFAASKTPVYTESINFYFKSWS